MDTIIPKPGDTVTWKWFNKTAEGIVIEVSNKRAEIISRGSHIARNGTPENPAIVIEHANGNHVIKLMSELQKHV